MADSKPPRRRPRSYTYFTVHSQAGAMLPESFLRAVEEFALAEAEKRNLRVFIQSGRVK